MITYGSTTLTSYNTITKIEVYYYKSTSATSLSGGSWSTTKPTWENGKYIWQKIRTTYEGKLENGQYYSESDPVNITGQQGQQGEAGTSAYSYKLNASDTIVSVSKNGIYSTNSITFSATSKQGNENVNPYKGRFKIETTTDGITWTTQYTSSTNESSKTFTIPENITNIRCSLYQADGTTVLLDITSVSIVRDGTDATGLKDSIPFYLASDKETDITIYDEGWSTIRPALDATNKYLWVYYLSRYSNGTTDPELIEVFGDIATFENNGDISPIYSTEVDIEPIQDLNGFDHAWIGGNGKNLLAYPYYTGDTHTSNGITFTVEKYSNGAIKDVLVNGTASAATFFNFNGWGSVKTDMSKYCGQSMILSGGTSDARIVMQYRNPNSTSNIYLVNDTGGSGVTFTVPDASDLGTWAIFISISSGLTFNNVRVYPMLRFASETDGTYEPYENICPIEGQTNMTITRTGKNLANTEMSQVYQKYYRLISGISSQSSVNNIKVGSEEYKHLILLFSGIEYTITVTLPVPTSNYGLYTAYYGGNNNEPLKQSSGTVDTISVNFTPTHTGLYVFWLYKGGTDITFPSVGITDPTTVKFQIEINSMATEYEPYCGNSYEIDFPTDAGTIFKGKLVIDENGDGQLIQTHKSIILDNTNRNGYTLYSPNIRPYWIIDDKALFSSYIEANNHIYTDSCVISHNGVINNPQNAKVQTLSAYTTKIIYVTLINITTQEAMDAYLADHPIQLVYELAEPIIYYLTAKQILALLKTNHIYANTGNTTVRYYDNQRVTVPYIDYSATSAFEYSVRAYEATQPLYTNTYSELIGSANDTAGASFYFAKIHPDSYITNYKVKMKVRVIEPESYAETIDIQFGGYGSTFSSYDAYTTRTQSIGIYYINLYKATKAGIETNHKGHALGIGLKNATNPTNTDYKRTVIVDILELDGCTIEMLDTAVKYADMDGTGSTNYSGTAPTEMAVATVGQNATNNTNTSYTQYANAVKAGVFGVKRYTLLMKDSENTWSSFINQANSTATTKTVCQGGFLLGKLLYSAGGAEYASGANTSTVYDAYPFDFRYSTNCGQTLISHQPVYLVGTIENDGLFYLDVSQWWTQTEPTYADGKVYVYVGMSYSTYQVWLNTENPAYVYYNGEFILYDKAVTLQNIASLKDSLETQIDSKVETWCQKTNPASNWTAEERPNHTGDLWYYIGESDNTYKNNTTYQYNGSTNTWSAYSANPDLFDKIDGKTAIYYGTQSSVTSAEEGDYLVDETDGSSYRWNNGAWVKVTDYKTAIDEIEIGGRNLLKWTSSPKANGAYSIKNPEETDGWYAWNSALGEITRTNDGIKFTHSSSSGSSGIVIPLAFVNAAVKDVEYTLSFKYRTNLTSIGFPYLLRQSNGNISYNHAIAITPSETTWEYFTTKIQWTSTDNYNTWALLIPYSNVINGWIEIQDKSMKLEKGSKATDWSFAPEDVEEEISTLRTDLQSQIDEKIQTFYQSTNPASSWTTTELRTPHDGDLWYYTGITTSTYTKDNVYRYNASNNTWSVYSASGELFDKVDGKSTIYYGTTSGTYTGVETGDYLVDSTDGSSYRWDGSKWVKVTDYQTTITNAIDNIQIGGRNLALDSSLTGNIQKWNPTADRWIKTIKDGYECLMCEGSLNTTATLTVPLTINSESYGVVPYNGLQLAFSADVLLEDVVKGTTNFYLALYASGQTIDGNWRGATLVKNSPHMTASSIIPNELNGIGWTRVWYIFKYEDYNWTNYLRPVFYARDFTGRVYVKNIKVEYGDYATDWTPAPEDVTSSIQTYVDTLQFQVDHMAEIYYGTAVPTLSNTPASDWDTNDIKDIHVDDLYYNTSTGYCYRFVKSGSTYSWTRIKDSDITAAATAASNANTAAGNAQTTANNANTLAGQKRRIFVTQPTPPYEVGDLWVEGSNGDIKKCKTTRATGSYTASDWELASKYTDDTTANEVNDKIDNLEIGGRNLLKNSKTLTDNWRLDQATVSNGIVTITPTTSRDRRMYQMPAAGYWTWTAGQEYTVSVAARSDNGASLVFQANGAGRGSKSIVTDSTWKRYSFTFVASKAETGSMAFSIVETSDKTIQFKEPKLEYGGKATSWTPAPEDTQADIDTALAQSVEYIIGTQTTTTGTWTGKTVDKELKVGKTIAYKLPYSGSGNASLVLTLADNTTTNAIAVYLNTTRVTTHFGAGSVINMTYDGQYWRASSIPNTNNYDRRQHSNAITAKTAVAAGHLIVGNSTGYQQITSTSGGTLEFDLGYPILWAYSKIDATKTSNATYEAYPSVNFSTSGTIQDGAVNKMLWLKGTIRGNIFTLASTNFLTTQIPTSDDGMYYIPLGIMSSATAGYFSSSNRIYAYIDEEFQPLDNAAALKATSAYETAVQARSEIVQTQQTLSLQIRDISVGGANLFERTKTFEGTANQSTAHDSFTEFVYKDLTVKSANTVTFGNKVVELSAYQYTDLTSNMWYSFSFYAKGNVDIGFMYAGTGNAVIDSIDVSWDDNTYTGFNTTSTSSNIIWLTPTNNWQRYSVVFHIEEQDITALHRLIGLYARPVSSYTELSTENKDILITETGTDVHLIMEGNEVQICGYKLELGNKPTDWTPADNDKATYDNIISQINLSKEGIAIRADKIRLEGMITANEGFSIDEYGNMTANNGTFNGIFESYATEINENTFDLSINNGHIQFYNNNRALTKDERYVGYIGGIRKNTTFTDGSAKNNDAITIGLYNNSDFLINVYDDNTPTKLCEILNYTTSKPTFNFWLPACIYNGNKLQMFNRSENHGSQIEFRRYSSNTGGYVSRGSLSLHSIQDNSDISDRLYLLSKNQGNDLAGDQFLYFAGKGLRYSSSGQPMRTGYVATDKYIVTQYFSLPDLTIAKNTSQNFTIDVSRDGYTPIMCVPKVGGGSGAYHLSIYSWGISGNIATIYTHNNSSSYDVSDVTIRVQVLYKLTY